MSQRECAGLNWPPLAISAVEPIARAPETVSRAGPAAKAVVPKSLFQPLRIASFSAPCNVMAPFSPSRLRGVGQLVKVAWRGSISSLVRSEPSGLIPVVAMPAESFQSRALGVTQLAKIAKSSRFDPWRVSPIARAGEPPP